MSVIDSGLRLSGWSRVLAVVLVSMSVLALWLMAGDATATAADMDVTDVPRLLFVSWFLALVAFAAWTGREPPELLCNPVALWCWLRGTHPERARAEDVARLRRLNLDAGPFTTAGEARRLIGIAEGRLPPTLGQQRELARYRPGHAIMTRASAERFLAERAEEEAWAEIEAWWEEWLEVGLEIEWPQLLKPGQRAAFDAASAALHRIGVDYPLPAVLPSFDVVAETARMQLALDLPRDLEAIQRELLADGVTRRELSPDDLRPMITPLLDIWRREPEFEWPMILLFLIARDRPALLVDPWAAREFVAQVQAMIDGDDERASEAGE